MDEISGLPARRGAFKLCDAVFGRGETLEQAEGWALRGIDGPADRALARALAGETLRWLVDLDALIDSATKKRLPDDAKPRMVLRLMLAGWLRLETPPHAVVATGLPLLKGGPRRLAHGVFSTLSKKGVSLPLVPSLPPEVAARWGERADAISAGLAVPPPLDLSLKNAGETATRAAAMGAGSICDGHLRLPRGTPIDRLPSFAEGAWWVQDFAAQLPARLLGPGDGRRVLDLCAAPGGKSMQLAAAGWKVTALDSSERRLEMMRDNLARTGLSAEIVHADATSYVPAKQFDAILLDAPCTATGTCRRHPDVVHRIGSRQIAEMVAIQRGLIEQAVGWLQPGTSLTYAVCSLEQEEGEGQADWINATFDLEPLPVAASQLPMGLEPTPQGHLRTDPGMLAEAGGLDGFFVARWVKN